MSRNEEDKIDLPSEHVESGYGNEKYELQQEPDPFGDEEFAEVKYRTLQWWCVPVCPMQGRLANAGTGRLD